MTAIARDRIIPVADLVDRPGASRRVDLTLPEPDGLDAGDAVVHGNLRLHGVIESVVEGLLLRGTLEADLGLQCARCLAPVAERVAIDVVELFLDAADIDEAGDLDPGYEIVEGTLNLDTLVRDALLPAVPYRPLCQPDCQGLCPQCGADRNETACDCSDTAIDARWAALEGLRLPNRD